jgi:hypothetical protein
MAGMRLNPEERERARESSAPGMFPPGNYELPNLRVLRGPLPPWEVSSQGIHATVTSSPARSIGNHSEWTVDIGLDVPGRAWKLVSVTPESTGVSIVQPPEGRDSGEGRGFIRLNVISSPLGSPARNREPVRIRVTLQLGEETRTAILNVDMKYVFGDYVAKESAAEFAKAAERYIYDPAIERLVTLASLQPRLPLRQEIERFIRLANLRYLRDPPDFARGFSGSAYVLSPSETYRYGGDCEDMAIFVAAYLARRGFRTWIVMGPGHAFAMASEPGPGAEPICVDIARKDWDFDHRSTSWFSMTKTAPVNLQPKL